jgi:N-hydroxyarylamine O-acetyltransferase
MRLSDYFARIGFALDARPDLATLSALHQAHLGAIAFENLDVQLGRPIDIGPEAVFDKLVRRRRGGWCYEQNGLMAWALGEIGFDVTRMSGGVMRERAGDAQMGNHLCLMVRLDQPYLVDVGFGGSLAEPLPIRPGERHDAPFLVGLSDTGDGYWRYAEGTGDGAFSFDFRAEPADEALLAAQCLSLQTDPASSFVQNLVVQKRSGARHVSLRGRVLSELGAGAPEPTVLESADALVATLDRVFGLDIPEAAGLWPAICARHEMVFGAGAG